MTPLRILAIASRFSGFATCTARLFVSSAMLNVSVPVPESQELARTRNSSPRNVIALPANV